MIQINIDRENGKAEISVRGEIDTVMKDAIAAVMMTVRAISEAAGGAEYGEAFLQYIRNADDAGAFSVAVSDGEA